jgi:HNH endonuclease
VIGQPGQHAYADRANDLSQDRLKSLLSYDPDTGIFRWAVKRANKEIGDETGCPAKSGYLQIGLDYKLYYAHRLAWLYVYGEWPKSQHLDHVNGDRSDNRVSNLREASASLNGANSKLRINNTSGVKGVSKRKNKFVAQVTVSRKLIYIGEFDTSGEAAAAYANVARKYFGEFARTA